MTTRYSEGQIQEGIDGFMRVLEFRFEHNEKPPEIDEISRLPLEIKHPITEEVRFVLIGDLTMDDVLEWMENKAIELLVQKISNEGNWA